MAALVGHRRPTFDTTRIRAGMPVTSGDWSAMGAIANWGTGHGGMLIPWTAIGRTITSASTDTYHFYIAPKAAAVERVWYVNLRTASAVGITAEVTAGAASMVVARPVSTRTARHSSHRFRESLSAKTSTAGDATIAIKAVGGNVTVESIAMYEQTRSILDTADAGVDLTTLRLRQPIVDLDDASIGGATDAYKNLDARRAGLFHWSTTTGSALAVTGAGYAELFALRPPILMPVPTTTDTTSSVTVAVYSKVNAGTADFRTTTVSTSGTVTINVSRTSFGWDTGTLTGVDAEDLTAATGLRSGAFDGLIFEARKGTATQLDIAAISVVRTTTPI